MSFRNFQSKTSKIDFSIKLWYNINIGIKGGFKLILTKKQYELLISMFNASICRAQESGIPIGKEYYEDIDTIRDKLYQEMAEANKR